MLEDYRHSILTLYPELTGEEWEYLKKGITINQYQPRDIILEEGKKNHLLCFVQKGLVRAFYHNDQGEEVTTMFAKEGHYATDYPSLLLGRPSRYSLQCLEPTTILTRSYGHIQEGYQKFTGLEHYGRLIAEIILMRLHNRVESFQFEDAEQRYLNFIKRDPKLFNRISLTHLSSYLGIERPSLSRIRKKIAGH